MTQGLPRGWQVVQVQELFHSFSGGTPSKGNPAYWGGKIPWFSSGDIKSSQVTSASESITWAGLDNSSSRLCRPGSVLIVVRSGVLKHTLPVAILEREAAINQDLKCFDSGDDAINKWLALSLRASENDLLALNREGTTVQSVKYETLKEHELPIPPLAEQQRIVAKLEVLLGKVDACRKRLEKIPVILKRFRQSVLAAACSGRLTADWREENLNIDQVERNGDQEPEVGIELPPTWSWVLSAVEFEFVTSGSRGWAKYYSDEGAIFIRVGNLNHDSIKLDLSAIQRVTPPASAEGRRTKVQRGDILISITADVGMIALVDEDIGDAFINQHVSLARPVGSLDRKYVAYFLAARNGGQDQFQNLQRGATKVGLGLGDIRNIWIARPPLLEQHEIVRRVEALSALADQIETRYAKAKTHVDRLTQSLLAKAFRGDLVPQDTNDEPASVLLERIRSQRKEPGTQRSQLPRRRQ